MFFYALGSMCATRFVDWVGSVGRSIARAIVGIAALFHIHSSGGTATGVRAGRLAVGIVELQGDLDFAVDLSAVLVLELVPARNTFSHTHTQCVKSKNAVPCLAGLGRAERGQRDGALAQQHLGRDLVVVVDLNLDVGRRVERLLELERELFAPLGI